MTTTTCQARLGCLVGRVDAQRQRRPPSRARGTSRFCLGAGSVSRCLFHFATGPLRRNRNQLAIGRRTSSINARRGRHSSNIPKEKTYLHCSTRSGAKSWGKLQNNLPLWPGRTRTCHPRPRTRAHYPSSKRGRCGATDRFCANRHTHIETRARLVERNGRNILRGR